MKKRLMMLCLCLVMVMASGMALGEANIVLEEEAFETFAYSGTAYAYFSARVVNQGDVTARLRDATIEALDKDGNVLSSRPSSRMEPRDLKPGETGYITTELTIYDVPKEGPNPIESIRYELKSAQSGYPSVYASLPAEGAFNPPMQDRGNDVFAVGTVHNDGEETVYAPTMVLILRDQAGQLLLMMDYMLYDIGVPPGQKVSARLRLPEPLIAKWLRAGKFVTTVEAVAHYHMDY